MNALRVHGGGAVLERISDNDGALLIGEVVRGIAMLDGRDEAMVSVSQSSRTVDEGDSSLDDGIELTVDVLGVLNNPIISPGIRNGVVGCLAIQRVADTESEYPRRHRINPLQAKIRYNRRGKV